MLGHLNSHIGRLRFRYESLRGVKIRVCLEGGNFQLAMECSCKARVSPCNILSLLPSSVRPSDGALHFIQTSAAPRMTPQHSVITF